MKATRRPCGVCTLDGRYHPRGTTGRVIWCAAAERMWPTQPLITKAGTRTELCRLLGIEERRAFPDMLTDVQADRWAIRAGYHPNQVWPGWSDAGLRYVDRVFLESGWRQAWLQWERTTNNAVDAA